MKTVKWTQNESGKFAKDKAYWQDQIKSQSVSQLSKAAYCRVNKLNYDKFNYWLKRLANKEALLPVKIKGQSIMMSDDCKPLCTVMFKNGSQMHIHDQQTLLIVLDRMGSL